MKYVILSEKEWHKDFPNKLSNLGEFILIDKKENFTKENLLKINPKYVFVPHWSYIIPPDIYENFTVIIFHMTDLPFGRGGSPLQNLIVNGFKKTKISAIKCVKEIDAGDVYLKHSLSLNGSARQIFLRASKVILKMIVKIVQENPEPKPQEGIPSFFKRRVREDGNIEHLSQLKEVYDYIRMLDCEGYPNAFLPNKNFNITFQNAKMKGDFIEAKVIISKL